MKVILASYDDGITPRKVQIIDETLKGLYVLKPFMLLDRRDGSKFIAPDNIFLASKSHVSYIKEEEINVRDN